MSDKRILSGSIALTKLTHAITTTKKGTKCILLPIEDNYFTDKDGAVYLNCQVIVRNESDQHGQDGFISQKLDSAKYKELGKEKANELKLPILGNIKEFNAQAAGDSSGKVYNAEPFDDEENDDLPF